MIDYKRIIENLDSQQIINLLQHFGAENIVERDNAIICNTICHNISGGSQKLYYYKNSHSFMCYTECGYMSIFHFLKHYYELHNVKYDWFTDVLQVALKCANMSLDSAAEAAPATVAPLRDKYETEQKIHLPEVNPGILNVFTHYYPPEWLADRITKEAIDKFNILYSISQNKIIIPHYDPDNRLIGIRGRALNEWEIENIGKYAPVEIEGKWYSHKLSLNLYGLNVNKDNIKKYGIAFIFESEKSVLQLYGYSMAQCGVAACGSNINRFQIKQLLEVAQPREIIICFDNEEKPGEEKYFNKLYNLAKKYSNYATFSFIYDRRNLTNKKSSPTDEGQLKFQTLLKERVFV